MFRFVLIAIALPSFAVAQNDDPRIRIKSPAPGVKEQHIETVYYYHTRVENEHRTAFQKFMDLHPKHDTIIVDTAATETRYFSTSGRLDSSDYNFSSPVHSVYTYTSDTSWICVSMGKYRLDSTIVSGDSAEVRREIANERTWFEGDSGHFEMYNDKGRRIYKNHYFSSPTDSFWNYNSVGGYSRKTIAHGKSIDTVRYWNSHNRWLITVINHYDSLGHCTRSDYFNWGLKHFDLVTLRLNPKWDNSLYLPVNGNELAMHVKREYDSQGLLLREAWYSPRFDTPILVKYYSYELYS